MRNSEWLLRSLQFNIQEMTEIEREIKTIHAKPRLDDYDIEYLEKLHRQEFKLAMNQTGIYEDLVKSLDSEDEFTKRRLLNEAHKILQVAIITM